MTTRGIAHHNARGVVHGGQLSELQIQIEALLKEQGATHKSVGAKLGVSVDGIKRHLEKIREFRAYERMRRSL
jgi:predicted ArsR family transcriptional regulator